MSSYATLSLGSMGLAITRNDIDPGLMWMFRPSDRRTERIDRRDRRRLARYVTDDFIDEYDESKPVHNPGVSMYSRPQRVTD